jgi:hypothetical protein
VLSSRSNHACATRSSPRTFSTGNSSTSADSSAVRPPKKRISISFVFRGSFRSSSQRASSIASITDGRSIPALSASSSEHLGSPLPRISNTRVIAQDLPHNVAGNTQEMRPAAKAGLVLLDEPDIGFMNERGRLWRIPGPLVPKMACSQFAQLRINHWHQAVQRILVPVGQFLEN